MRDAGCLQYRNLILDPTKQLINFDTLAVYSLVVNIAYAGAQCSLEPEFSHFKCSSKHVETMEHYKKCLKSAVKLIFLAPIKDYCS